MRRFSGICLVSVFCLFSVLSPILNEAVMFQMTGYKRGVTCDDGGDGSKSGHFVQHVCLNATTVVKAPKACIETSAIDLLNCKWRLWKQVYTNNLWVSTYGKLPFVADILQHDGNGAVVMTRCRHNETVLPDIAYNSAAMIQLDEMLGKHGHIVTDVRTGHGYSAPINEYNVLLDDNGRICLIDFNLFPVALKPLMEKLNQKRLYPFKNIYGGGHIMDWIRAEPSADGLPIKQQTFAPALAADIESPRRGLRATIQDILI